MPNPSETPSLIVKCPNCKQVKEPSFNETTKRYTCPLCSASVDAQVFIAKKKLSGKPFRRGKYGDKE